MWEIESRDSRPGTFVVNMDVAYGRTPTGYLQRFPNSSAALPLAIGKVYYFSAETAGAPGAQGFFYKGPSGPILIDVPGLCESSFVGDVEPVKCGTHEPYIEPKDLEEFVQQNRVK